MNPVDGTEDEAAARGQTSTWSSGIGSELLDILQNMPGSGNIHRSPSGSSSKFDEAPQPDERPRKLERPKFKKDPNEGGLERFAGESGLGKSTFLRSLFNLKPCKGKWTSEDLICRITVDKEEEEDNETDCDCSVCASIWPIEEAGVINKRRVTFPVENGEILLTVYDTPGLSPKQTSHDIVCLLDDLVRQPNAEDLRKSDIVHVCLYFLSPHRVTRGDLENMKMIQEYTNIVPILAKADSYTAEELNVFKSAVLGHLIGSGVEVFALTRELRQVYAVVGQNRQNIGARSVGHILPIDKTHSCITSHLFPHGKIEGADQPLRPWAPDSPFDNKAVWELLNTHSAELMTAAQTKRETVLFSFECWPILAVLLVVVLAIAIATLCIIRMAKIVP